MKTVHLFALLCLLLKGCKNKEHPKATSEEPPDPSALIASVVQAEDLLLDFSAHLENMGPWMQLCLDKKNSGTVPPPPPSLKKLIGLKDAVIITPNPDTAISTQSWPVSKKPLLLKHSLHPWRILCHQFDHPTEGKFGTLSATLPSPDTFVLKTIFSVKMTRNGMPYGLSATQTLVWRKYSENWSLDDWIQHDLTLTCAPLTLFVDTLAEASPNQ